MIEINQLFKDLAKELSTEATQVANTREVLNKQFVLLYQQLQQNRIH